MFLFEQVAGMAGFEPANDGVKVRCLTAWLHPYKKVVKKGIENDSLSFSGVGNGARTHDTRNHNPVLCQLSYTHHIKLARQERFELPTYCLEGSCSILLSYWRILAVFFLLNGAGDGNRTHVSSLEGWCSTIELHPHMGD